MICINADSPYLANFVLEPEFECAQWWRNDSLSKRRHADHVAVDVCDEGQIAVGFALTMINGPRQIVDMVHAIRRHKV